MSHKKFGPDRFSRFDVYWIKKKHPDKPNFYIEGIYPRAQLTLERVETSENSYICLKLSRPLRSFFLKHKIKSNTGKTKIVRKLKKIASKTFHQAFKGREINFTKFRFVFASFISA